MKKIALIIFLVILGVVLLTSGFLLEAVNYSNDTHDVVLSGDNYNVYFIDASKFNFTLNLRNVSDRFLLITNSIQNEVKLPLNHFDEGNVLTMFEDWQTINSGDVKNLLPPIDCKVIAIYINSPSYSDKIDVTYGDFSGLIKYPFERMQCLDEI